VFLWKPSQTWEDLGDVVGEAYALMANGKSGKVAVVFDEELK
jgi:hypothetical protein